MQQPVRPSKLEMSDLLEALGFCVLERIGQREFRLLGEAPEWLDDFSGESLSYQDTLSPGTLFSFLDNFLYDAERFWEEPEGLLKSGPWLEVGPRGQELHLEASVLALKDRQLLLIEKLGETYTERRDLLQKAREHSLNHQRLIKEVQLKEVLLHCIIHDLAGPLMGIKGIFTLLQNEKLGEAGERRLKIGLEAAQKMESMVEEILRVFSAEVESLQAFSVAPEDAPDLLSCLRNVVDTLLPAAQLKKLKIRIVPQLDDQQRPILVAGEPKRLERVFFNLLENAFRHSPSRGQVEVRLKVGEERVRTDIIDEGPGVAAAAREGLFRKFAHGVEGSGKVGLGLYFCRIVVERWGGRIGYSASSPKGSSFWFELPRVKLVE